jgi:hypothetical protein
MRVRFSDSEQWSSPVKPPRAQNYVKPNNARTRVHVQKARASSGLRCRSLLVGVATQYRITGREAHDVLAALGKFDHQGFDVALFA